MAVDSETRKRARAIYRILTKTYPNVRCELDFKNPLQLIVAVVLSAQCTDKRVNETTPSIFLEFPTPQKMALAKFDELFPLVKSISYPNNKTKHLIRMSQLLLENFNGEVPMTIAELVTLPGVGRKTANVITSVIDQQPNMAVDTHVFRVSRRIGLVPMTAKTPLSVEKELIKNIPSAQVHTAHHWLILHGRYTCLARNPKCNNCGIQAFCKQGAKIKKASDV